MTLLARADAGILLLLVLLNLAATVTIVLAARVTNRERRRRDLVDLSPVGRSELTTALSLIVPVGDDARCVVSAVRELLDSELSLFEVIVVDDGSQAATIDALRRAFALIQVERVPRSTLRTRRVTRAYASPLDTRLLVLDKQPGGRADALNTGLRFARYPLVCPVDPQVTLDRDALVRMARLFQTSTDMVACGAPLRRSRRPGSLVARVAAGRLGGALFSQRSLALFSREAVVAAGGYGALGTGEDLELVLRLQRHCRDSGRRYRIASLGRPVGSVPAARASNRSITGALACHRGMLLRRRYGLLGCVVLPALTACSLARRPLAIGAAAVAIAGLALGAVGPSLTILQLVLAVSAASALSIAALLLDDRDREIAPPIAGSPAQIGLHGHR